MSIQKTVLPKDADETVSYVFDFTAFPEIKAGDTIASATVPAVSGLTIGTPAVTTADRDGVDAGKGVEVVIAGGTAGETYTCECRAVLSSGSIRVVKGQLVVE